MTPPESQSDHPSLGAASLPELAQEYASLRFWFHLVLLMVLLLSSSFCVYLLREVSLARRQIRDFNNVVSQYERVSLPVMIEFRTKLYDFARKDPDFMAIFTKYFNPTNAPNSGVTPAVQAPQDSSSLQLPPGRE